MWISRKTKVLWGKVIVQRRQSACCYAMTLTPLWILRGVKVKNCHQISHWFQLVLPSTKQPLSVCDHRLVLILRLVPLHLIATGPLSVLQPDYSPPPVVCMQNWAAWASPHVVRFLRMGSLTGKRLLIRLCYGCSHTGLWKVKTAIWLQENGLRGDFSASIIRKNRL